MTEGSDLDEVGRPVEEAAVLGGVLRKRDTGRLVRRHEGGLVVEDKGGPIVLPYATTQAFSSELPSVAGEARPKGRADWTFARRGARWSSGSIDRGTPLAGLCRAAVAASTEVRGAIVRRRLANGDTVDFGRLSVTALELWIHGHRPLPWAEVVGIERRPLEPVHLATRSHGTFTLADSPVQIADLAVLHQLIAENG